MDSMGKAEIIEELARLSPRERAEVREQLEWLAARDEAMLDVNVSPAAIYTTRATPHIHTPRRANPSQSSDFVKQVSHLPAHA
jgi:hypothetical protein